MPDVGTETTPIGRPENDNNPNKIFLAYPTSDLPSLHFKPTRCLEAQIQRHNILLTMIQERRRKIGWKKPSFLPTALRTVTDRDVDRISFNIGRASSSHRYNKKPNQDTKRYFSARPLGTRQGGRNR